MTAFEQELDRVKKELPARSGAERIRFIRRHNIFDAMIDPIALTYAGFIAMAVIKRKIKKWLGEEWDPSLEKSPPGNITSEMGLMIGDLADAARPYPEVVRYLEQAEDHTFYEGLSEVEGGGAFREKLDEFMEKFGMRAPGEIDITRVRYREAPTMLVPSILSHLKSNAPGEHREKFKRGEKEAQEAIQSLLRAGESDAGRNPESQEAGPAHRPVPKHRRNPGTAQIHHHPLFGALQGNPFGGSKNPCCKKNPRSRWRMSII